MGERKYQFTRLSARHKLILNHIADGCGIAETAEKLGTTSSTVSRAVHSRAGQEYLNELLERLYPRVIRTLGQLLDDPNPAVRLKAAKIVLNVHESGQLQALGDAALKAQIEKYFRQPQDATTESPRSHRNCPSAQKRVATRQVEALRDSARFRTTATVKTRG